MKVSICIPQYNRIEFLKIALLEIEKQEYTDIEVCISDDASTDGTYGEIQKIRSDYKYNLIYHRFDTNQGYDRNLRKALELATGDYCFILGNDDTLNDSASIQRLTNFLKANNYPDVGFCNSADFLDPRDIQIRAHQSRVWGSGPEIALQHYSSFSFVAGLIFKKEAFNRVNTDKFDKSIYVQIYLAALIIATGGSFFMFAEPLVLKDIRVNNEIANSYRDTLPLKWKDFKVLDAGLPSYALVTYAALKDAGIKNYRTYAFQILKRIYLFTYPFWLVDYRENNAFVASMGLIRGLNPPVFKFFHELNYIDRFKLMLLYASSSVAGLLMPVLIFKKLKAVLYRYSKKV